MLGLGLFATGAGANNAQNAVANAARVMAVAETAVAVAMSVATSLKKPAQRWAAVKTAAAAKKRAPKPHLLKVVASRDKRAAVVRAQSASRVAPPLSKA